MTRTVLVTGASSGIGRAVARKLLQNGHKVIGASRDCSRFRRSVKNFFSMTLDLSCLSELSAAIDRLTKQHPDLDAAVFCAGYGRFGCLEEFSYDQINRLMTTNFTAQAFLTRGLLPVFKRKQTSDLIFIGSEAALKGSRKGAVYCASKFALRGFAQALRDECGNSRVRVGIINPGMVQTPFFDDLSFQPGDAPGQFIEPDDVAEAVSYMLNASPGMVIDEINLSPLSKVVNFKKPSL